MAGSITVPWAKVKTLNSTQRFAVIEKNLKLSKRDASTAVPDGSVQADGKTLTIGTTSGPRTDLISNTGVLMNAAAFDKALRKPRSAPSKTRPSSRPASPTPSSRVKIAPWVCSERS